MPLIGTVGMVVVEDSDFSSSSFNIRTKVVKLVGGISVKSKENVSLPGAVSQYAFFVNVVGIFGVGTDHKCSGICLVVQP